MGFFDRELTDLPGLEPVSLVQNTGPDYGIDIVGKWLGLEGAYERWLQNILNTR